MRIDRDTAFKLRRQNKSYREIESTLNIPRSTLSEWLKTERWSERIKVALNARERKNHIIRLQKLNYIRGKDLALIYQGARKEATQELAELKFHPLFITGVSIYWGEGSRRMISGVRVSNTDPLMIKLFVKFLIEVCGVQKSRIRTSLLLYPDLNESICKKFWKQKVGFSNTNFTKSIFIQGKHKTRRIPYGVCTIGVSSTYLKKKMDAWLQLLPNEILLGKYYMRV